MAEIAAEELTVRVIVAEPVQPAVVVPVTLYVVVAAGDAVKLVPDPLGLHVYELPPLAAIVELWPAQMDAGVAVAVIAAEALTVTITVAVPGQPAALVPVTV